MQLCVEKSCNNDEFRRLERPSRFAMRLAIRTFSAPASSLFLPELPDVYFSSKIPVYAFFGKSNRRRCIGNCFETNAPISSCDTPSCREFLPEFCGTERIMITHTLFRCYNGTFFQSMTSRKASFSDGQMVLKMRLSANYHKHTLSALYLILRLKSS